MAGATRDFVRTCPAPNARFPATSSTSSPNRVSRRSRTTRLRFAAWLSGPATAAQPPGTLTPITHSLQRYLCDLIRGLAPAVHEAADQPAVFAHGEPVPQPGARQDQCVACAAFALCSLVVRPCTKNRQTIHHLVVTNATPHPGSRQKSPLASLDWREEMVVSFLVLTVHTILHRGFLRSFQHDHCHTPRRWLVYVG